MRTFENIAREVGTIRQRLEVNPANLTGLDVLNLYRLLADLSAALALQFPSRPLPGWTSIEPRSSCSRCGMDLSQATGVVCCDLNCPTFPRTT